MSGGGDYRVNVRVNVNDSELDTLKRQIANLEGNALNIKINKGSLSTITTALTNMEAHLSRIKAQLATIGNGGRLQPLYNSVNRVGKQMSVAGQQAAKFGMKTTQELNKVNSSANRTAQSLQKVSAAAAKMNKQYETRALQSRMATISDRYARLDGKGNAYVKDVKKEYKNFQKTYNSDADIEKKVAAYNRLTTAMSRAENEARRLKVATVDATQKQTAINKVEGYIKRNTKAQRKYGDELQRVIKLYKKANSAADMANADKAYRNVQSKISADGLTGNSIMAGVGKKMKEYAAYFSVATLAMEAVQAIRAMGRAVLEVDTAMTGLYRVTDLTSNQYDALFDKMTASANEYGRTLTEIINATADWVRAGFDADTAVGLAEVTSMYQNVSDLDYKEASENILTSYNGFKDELLKVWGGDEVAAATHIVDVLNELDNNFSVTSAGLGEGLSRSASALMLAGNTYEEAAAMIGAVTEVTQDPEKAGSAMKILSLRLRGMKGELVDMGEETDVYVENISKMQGQVYNLTRGKVNIFDAKGDFKSTYDIMKGIAEVYDDLTTVEQADLLETIAGKHRANDVAALINNMENAIAMEESAMNSTGSASKENARFVDSLQGKINKLKTAWQTFSNVFMESDFLKGLAEFGTGFLNTMSSVISTLGTLPTLFTSIALGMSVFKNVGVFKTFENGLAGMSNKLGMFGRSFSEITQAFNAGKSGAGGKGTSGFFGGLAAAKNSMSKGITKMDLANIKAYNAEIANSKTHEQAFAKTMTTSSKAAQDMANSANGAKIAVNGLTASTIASRAAMVAATVAATAFNMVLTMGIGMAIMAVISKITSLINAKKELASTINEVTSSVGEQHDELIRNRSTFDDLAERYDKLSKGVYKFNNANKSLTTEEYEEYKDVVNQIADMVPSLVSGYDAQGNAIITCADSVDVLTEAYENLIIQQNKALLEGDGEDYHGFSDILTDFQNDYEKLQDSSDGIFRWNKKNTINASNALNDIFGLNIDKNNFDATKDAISAYVRNASDVAENEMDRFLVIGQALQQEMDRMGLKLENMEPPSAAWGSSDDWSEYITRVYMEHPEAARAAVKDMNSQFDEVAKETKDAMSKYVENAFLMDSYPNINEDMQGFVNNIIGNLDSEFIHSIIGDKTGKEAEEAMTTWLTNLLTAVNKFGPEMQSKISSAFNLGDMFQAGDISLGEYKDQLNEATEVINGIEGLDAEVKTQIIAELNTENITQDFDAFINRLSESGMEYSVAVNYANSLDFAQWAAAQELVMDAKFDWQGKTPEEIQQEIDRLAAIANAMSFTFDIETQTKDIEKVNEALAESASAAGLTGEALNELKNRYRGLDSYDAGKLFEKTANGIKVNREEADKLEKEYQDLEKSTVSEHLENLIDEYNAVTKEIDRTTNAQERMELINKRDNYAKQIEDLATYQAQLEGVTGAYQRWLDAQEGPEDYEGYAAIAQGREEVEDELSRGFLGNATKEYIDLLSGKDLRGGTIDDYANAWNELSDTLGSTSYNIHDLFTLDDDGNITASGIDRFFEGMQQDFEGSVAKFNEESGKWEYNFSQENLKKIQDEWGLGIEAIQLMLEAAQAAGYDVDWDGILDNFEFDTSNYDTLIEYAQSAQAELNKIAGFEDVEFNFETKNIKDASSEIAKTQDLYSKLIDPDGDGTVDLSVEGAEQARFILSTLLFQKQSLEDSNIAMNIDTSQLDESQADIAAAIDAVQNLREKYKNFEIAVSTGQGIEEAKAELSTALTDLQGLGDEGVEIAAQLMLGEGSNAEALKTQINSALESVGGEDIKVGVNLDETSIGALNTQLKTNFTPEATVKITGIDDSLVSGYQTTEKTAEGTVTWDNDDSLVVQFQNEDHYASGEVKWDDDSTNLKLSGWTATGTVTWTSGNNVRVTVVKQSEADGTAHVNGTAFAGGTVGKAFSHGDWGIKGSGVALGGELGQELVRNLIAR